MYDYRSIFVLSANTSTNTVKAEQLPSLLRQCGLKFTEKEGKRIINSLDQEDVTYEQFVEIGEELQSIPYEKAREAFQAFDTENSGFINMSLLKNLISDTEDLSEKEVEEILNCVSKETDKFNYESFLKECYSQKGHE